MSKVKSKFVLKEILLFFPMRKVLQVITYSKGLHEALGIKKEERSLLKRIYDTPLAPLHFSCRFSKNSTHINGFLYNKLKDYRNLIEEQAGNIAKETFNTNFVNYLKSLKNDAICMLDLADSEGLNLARQLPNLKFGLFLDYATNTQAADLSGINLAFFSDNLEKLSADVRNEILNQLARCPLEKMRLTFPSDLNKEKFQALPKLKKIQIANNWKNGDELIRALNSIQHMGDSIESLTIYTIQKCVDNNLIGPLKEALSNFKKVRSLYIRQSIQEVMPYDKFVDIFSSFIPTLKKLKFDLDIFESKKPITFSEFKNLEKVIIKNVKPKQSIYDLKHIKDVQIKYNKIPLHRGSLEGLKENVQGIHIIFDREGYSEDEETQILNAIKEKNLKLVSFRGINSTINQVLPKLEAENVECLELNNVLGEWNFADVLKRNKGVKSLDLACLGLPSPEHLRDIPQSTIIFPDGGVDLEELKFRKCAITDIPKMFKCCKNLTFLRFDQLILNSNDFAFFCNNIGQLTKLKSLFFGEIKLDNNQAPDNELFNKFFIGISTIKTLTSIEFKSDYKITVDFLKIFGKNLGYIKNLETLKISVVEPKDSFEARKILLQASEKLHHLKTLKLIMFDS